MGVPSLRGVVTRSKTWEQLAKGRFTYGRYFVVRDQGHDWTSDVVLRTWKGYSYDVILQCVTIFSFSKCWGVGTLINLLRQNCLSKKVKVQKN